MSWYIWVWGAISSLAALAWTGVGITELYTRLEERGDRLRQNEIARLAELKRECMRLRIELRRSREGENEFGRVCP